MEVIVGTYEHTLFGFLLECIVESEKEIWQLEPKFTDQGHAGCIKCTGTGGRYLASGSTDETIRLFDLKKHVELGTLAQQNGSITCIQFINGTNMLSASEDGTICVWETKSWTCLKVLKGHRAAINSLSVHPSGRLALSVSKDKTIRTWNLLSGRAAYVTTLKEVGELVRWSPAGDSYAVVSGCLVTLYRLNAVADPRSYKSSKYVLAIEFITNDIMVVAGDDENIVFHDFERNSVVQSFQAHSTRTKAICLTEDSEANLLLFSASSDGNIKVCRLNKKNLSEKAIVLAEVTLPGRPTCMTLRVPLLMGNKPLTQPPTSTVEAAKESEQSPQTNQKYERITSDRQNGAKKVKKRKNFDST